MAHNSGRIVISDMLGRMMAEQQIAIGSTAFEVNINDLPAGSYSISIWEQGKCLAMKRFQKIGTMRE